MKGTINIADFMDHLKSNNLVIVPETMLGKDFKYLQKQVLSKNMATCKEVSDSGIWGDITQTRVYQIAYTDCRKSGLLLVAKKGIRITEIVRLAIERISRDRGTLIN